MTKKATKEEKAETVGGTNEQVVLPTLDPEVPHYVFKSKYKEDVVTLKKGKKDKFPDGTMDIVAPIAAEFHRFTWATDDADLALILRNNIAKRLKQGSPLHILETTTKE